LPWGDAISETCRMPAKN